MRPTNYPVESTVMVPFLFTNQRLAVATETCNKPADKPPASTKLVTSNLEINDELPLMKNR